MEEQIKEVIIKKFAMNASGTFDYQKLMSKQEHFIPCQIEEQKEDVVIRYQLGELNPFSTIRSKRKQDLFLVLIDIAKMQELSKSYQFSLNPDNLYFDYCSRVYVMDRDVYKVGELVDESEFLLQYKSIIGHILYKRYHYLDFYNGGLDLLKKKKNLLPIYQAESVEAVCEILQKEYHKEVSMMEQTKILVNKSVFRFRKYYNILATLALLASLAIISYYKILVIPIEQAVMASDRAFIADDLILVIDSLKGLKAEQLDVHHKYTLAQAYIRGENLTKQQKDVILSTISIHGDERILDYWIAIGRLDALGAENIAMQCSNNELLLYAYLKEQNLLESNAVISGEQKAAKLSELEKKISDLAKQYETKE